MLVDRRRYRSGVPQEPPTTRGPAAEPRGPGSTEFDWVDLIEPDDDELLDVAVAYGLPASAVEDAQRSHPRPKLERDGTASLLVLRTLAVDGVTDLRPGEVLVVAAPGYVVTVRRGAAPALEGLRARLEADPARLARGPAVVVHAIATEVVAGFSGALDQLEAELDEVEEAVFSPGRGDHAERLYGLRREVQAARRAVDPLADVTDRLRRARGLELGADREVGFRDVHDHVLHSRERLQSVEVLADGALDAHLAQVAIQQNEDMRRISAWVAIAVVPTVVGGIYGMNFEAMPELSWRFGYPAALLLIATICATLYLGFRRNGWL